MIKINLIPQKRPKRRDKGQESLTVGFLAFLVAGGAVFFLVHGPMVDDIERLENATGNLARENADKEKQVAGLKNLRQAVEAATARKEVIMRLNKARATPAHLMNELSNILTAKRLPTMTTAMIKEIKENPNRELSQEWDPKHVWITKLVEKDGVFTLEGGAQSDGDMTQLALRLQASVYFHDVVPKEGKETLDKDSSITYYKFTIVGKVAY